MPVWSLISRWRPRGGASARAVVALHWGEADGRPRLAAARAEPGAGVVRVVRQAAADLPALVAEGLFRDATRVLMLDASQRQTMVLDAPPVPPTEWADALRWPVAKALEADAEDLLLDLASVPPMNDRGGQQVLVAAARLSAVRPVLDALAQRGLPPRAVDVVDMAQRNLVLATTPPDAADTAAQVVVGAHAGELLVGLVAGGELCVARNVALPPAFSADVDDDAVTERLVLHLQRTVDLLERQITRFAVTGAAVLLDDFPPSAAAALREALPVPSRAVGLADLAPGLDSAVAPGDRGLLARLAALARLRADRPSQPAGERDGAAGRRASLLAFGRSAAPAG